MPSPHQTIKQRRLQEYERIKRANRRRLMGALVVAVVAGLGMWRLLSSAQNTSAPESIAVNNGMAVAENSSEVGSLSVENQNPSETPSESNRLPEAVAQADKSVSSREDGAVEATENDAQSAKTVRLSVLPNPMKRRPLTWQDNAIASEPNVSPALPATSQMSTPVRLSKNAPVVEPPPPVVAVRPQRERDNTAQRNTRRETADNTEHRRAAQQSNDAGRTSTAAVDTSAKHRNNQQAQRRNTPVATTGQSERNQANNNSRTASGSPERNRNQTAATTSNNTNSRTAANSASPQSSRNTTANDNRTRSTTNTPATADNRTRHNNAPASTTSNNTRNSNHAASTSSTQPSGNRNSTAAATHQPKSATQSSTGRSQTSQTSQTASTSNNTVSSSLRQPSGSPTRNQTASASSSNARAEAILNNRTARAQEKSIGAANPSALLEGSNRRLQIQVGVYSDENRAREVQRRLAGAGVSAYVAPVEGSNGKQYRVRTGTYSTGSAADNAMAKIKMQGYDGIFLDR